MPTDFERASFEVSEVVRAEPIPIPEGVLGRPSRAMETAAIAARSTEAVQRFLLHGLPTVLLLLIGLGWAWAGWYRHDGPAYVVACALCCAAIVSRWASGLRAF